MAGATCATAAGATCATATSARFHKDMTVRDWLDPGQVDGVVVVRPAAHLPAKRIFVYVSRPVGALHCVTLTY